MTSIFHRSLSFVFMISYMCYCFVLQARQCFSGDSLVLAWKANVKECRIELQQLNVELTVRAFDKATEQLPHFDDATSPLSSRKPEVPDTFVHVFWVVEYTTSNSNANATRLFILRNTKCTRCIHNRCSLWRL